MDGSELPLGLVLDPKNPKLISKLRELDQYDFTVISKKCERVLKWNPEDTDRLAKQAKQFLALALLDPDYYHVPAYDADQYWHRMILQTTWYKNFCDSIFGFFLSHDPPEYPATLGEETIDRSVALMKHWYGIIINRPAECSGGGGGDHTHPATDVRPTESTLLPPTPGARRRDS